MAWSLDSRLFQRLASRLIRTLTSPRKIVVPLTTPTFSKYEFLKFERLTVGQSIFLFNEESSLSYGPEMCQISKWEVGKNGRQLTAIAVLLNSQETTATRQQLDNNPTTVQYIMYRTPPLCLSVDTLDSF
jgi:hypothetical protein